MQELMTAIDVVDEKLKTCSKCGESKIVSMFSKAKRGRYGVRAQCRACDAIYAKQYGEEHKEELHNYYQKNKDKIAVYYKGRRDKAYRDARKGQKAKADKRYREKHKVELSGKKRQYRQINVEKVTAHKKEYYENNKDSCLEKNKQWFVDNPEKCREIKARYVQTHPEELKETARKSFKKRYGTAKGKLALIVSSGVGGSLRNGSKAGRRWESLVGFTVDQLKVHLEKQFDENMTWENYGPYWHLDHKIPIAVFNFETPEDIDFKRCWSLENLQPLEARQNISKGCRVDKPFQPALAIVI